MCGPSAIWTPWGTSTHHAHHAPNGLAPLGSHIRPLGPAWKPHQVTWREMARAGKRPVNLFSSLLAPGPLPPAARHTPDLL
eukprot:352952-Chlamydomonas_euryale.AAC.13